LSFFNHKIVSSVHHYNITGLLAQVKQCRAKKSVQLQ
jgi:hypothetical protein